MDEDVDTDVDVSLKMEKIQICISHREYPWTAKEENGHIWRQLRTARTFGRKRWSGLCCKGKKEGKGDFQRGKSSQRNLSVIRKLPK